MAIQTRKPRRTSQTGIGVSWSNPDNILTNNGNYTELVLTSGQTSKLLVLDDFGFSIPTGSTITDFVATFSNRGIGSSPEIDFYLAISGTQQGSESLVGFWNTPGFPQSYPEFYTVANHPTATLTPADVNDITFQLILFVRSSHTPMTVDFDWATLGITYDPPSGGGGGGTANSPIILLMS